MYEHRCMIVSADHVEFARSLALHLEPVSAQGMFPCPLSPTGESPATHYCSSGFVGLEFVPLLTDAESLSNAAIYAKSTGFNKANYSLEQCEALVASSDVSEDDPYVAFYRLELSIVKS